MKHSQRVKELRGMNWEQLKEELRMRRLELLKFTGEKSRRAGAGYDKSWHPDFSEIKKDIARIQTVMGEYKNIIGKPVGE